MRLAAEIVLQQQPTSVSCTVTCIAMAIGQPVQSLGVTVKRPSGIDQFGLWLAERGIWLERLPEGASFQNDAVYLVAARSLNMVGSDHCVVLDTRGPKENDNPRSGWKCYDPNEGREGKRVYYWMDEHHALRKFRLHDSSRYLSAWLSPASDDPEDDAS